MAESEIKGELTLGGGVVPASLSVAWTRRWSRRGEEALLPILASVDANELDRRLAASDELDALVSRAMIDAASSSAESKRRLLGQIVKASVLDTAKIDESLLLMNVLRDVEAPHIRCLTAISRAEESARETGEMTPVARGAEKPLTAAVREVVAEYPPPLLQALLSLGLIDGTVTWDGSNYITGMTAFGESLLDDLRSA
jgi:hypothetical protein